MTKKSSNANTKFYPFVSICTPTYNRRPFIEIMFQCFRNQTYPKSRVEWIIVDDGTDKIKDLIAKANIPQIKYFELEQKVYLGKKRNIMHSHCSPKSKYIVYMDDDDYYPPERIEHAIDRLESNPTALCAGSSEIYIYFKHIHKMFQCGPYGPQHATAGTFAFRTDLLKQTKYDDTAALAEEKAFLKDYTIPFVQLDPLKTILVFSHNHNTFDKKKMLENLHPQFCKESPKSVDVFIKNKNEEKIKKFFLEDIEELLKKYEPGEPKMKPDVIEQIKKIEEERGKSVQQVVMNRPGMDPIALSNEQILQLLQQQQQHLQEQQQIIQKQQEKMAEFQQIIQKQQEKIDSLTAANSLEFSESVASLSQSNLQNNVSSGLENAIKNNLKNKNIPEIIINI